MRGLRGLTGSKYSLPRGLPTSMTGLSEAVNAPNRPGGGRRARPGRPAPGAARRWRGAARPKGLLARTSGADDDADTPLRSRHLRRKKALCPDLEQPGCCLAYFSALAPCGRLCGPPGPAGPRGPVGSRYSELRDQEPLIKALPSRFTRCAPLANRAEDHGIHPAVVRYRAAPPPIRTAAIRRATRPFGAGHCHRLTANTARSWLIWPARRGPQGRSEIANRRSGTGPPRLPPSRRPPTLPARPGRPRPVP